MTKEMRIQLIVDDHEHCVTFEIENRDEDMIVNKIGEGGVNSHLYFHDHDKITDESIMVLMVDKALDIAKKALDK